MIAQVYEHKSLCVNDALMYRGEKVGVFSQEYFDKFTDLPPSIFFDVMHKKIRFCEFVGVIKIGDLTIEVLPKSDKHEIEEFTGQAIWQKVLIDMLKIALDLSVEITTHADINLSNHSVLDAYLHLFLSEVQKLCHQGLVKKYRRDQNNQYALKGKLLMQQHITKNMVHAERFYVEHTVYDRNNIYNSILLKALRCIAALNKQGSLSNACGAILLDFPECADVKVSEKLFQRLHYDRKTERYKKAIELARIILLNYHPDISGGNNNILAIMFDMNRLWEAYICAMLRKAGYNVFLQSKTAFWQSKTGKKRDLKPDLVIKKGDNSFVLDTKWKYNSEVSTQDLRQMFAYSHYFDSKQTYLVYPDKLQPDNPVKIDDGIFCAPNEGRRCGLMFIDLLKNNALNVDISKEITKNLP